MNAQEGLVESLDSLGLSRIETPDSAWWFAGWSGSDDEGVTLGTFESFMIHSDLFPRHVVAEFRAAAPNDNKSRFIIEFGRE